MIKSTKTKSCSLKITKAVSNIIKQVTMKRDRNRWKISRKNNKSYSN